MESEGGAKVLRFAPNVTHIESINSEQFIFALATQSTSGCSFGKMLMNTQPTQEEDENRKFIISHV
jgi:hypothetical protein